MTFPINLSRRHLDMWTQRREGKSLSKIASTLGVTRQAVSQALMNVEDKVEKTLQAAATASRIQVHNINPQQGILHGYSHEMNDKVAVTFSPRNGVQIWHYYAGRCDSCTLYKECLKLIREEAEERGIDLDEETLNKKPAEIAWKVFNNLQEKTP